MKKIVIDKAKCIGCGACEALAPNCFELKDDGKAYVKKGCKCEANCKQAIESCPVEAIKK